MVSTPMTKISCYKGDTKTKELHKRMRDGTCNYEKVVEASLTEVATETPPETPNSSLSQ